MNGEDGAIMAPEEKAREKIDQLLKEAGWAVQEIPAFPIGTGRLIHLTHNLCRSCPFA